MDLTLLSTLGILKGNLPVESPRATTRLLIDENESLLRNQCQIEFNKNFTHFFFLFCREVSTEDKSIQEKYKQ